MAFSVLTAWSIAVDFLYLERPGFCSRKHVVGFPVANTRKNKPYASHEGALVITSWHSVFSYLQPRVRNSRRDYPTAALPSRKYVCVWKVT
jgi:hypothetical protein